MRNSAYFLLHVFLSVAFTIAIQSCSTEVPVPQGIIVYNVSYLNLEQSILENVLPSEMTILFKGDLVRGQLRSIGGVVSSEFIGNQKTKEFKQLLKSYQEHYVCSLDEKGVKAFIENFPEVNLESTDETKVISGYMCNVTLAHPLVGGEPMRLYHTNDLGIIKPNWYTQFSEIEGVLLGYELEQFGMKLLLEAREIENRPVDDAVFVVDPKYLDVDAAKMESIFEKLIADFNE